MMHLHHAQRIKEQDPDSLGERIRAQRESRQMSQKEFAKVLNVHFSLLSLWELNKIVPPYYRLKQLISEGVDWPMPPPKQPARNRLSRAKAEVEKRKAVRIEAMKQELGVIEIDSALVANKSQTHPLIADIPTQTLLDELVRRLQGDNALKQKNAELRQLLAEANAKLERVRKAVGE